MAIALTHGACGDMEVSSEHRGFSMRHFQVLPAAFALGLAGFSLGTPAQAMKPPPSDPPATGSSSSGGGTAVPEPSSLVLFGAGAAAVMLTRRRRRRKD